MGVTEKGVEKSGIGSRARTVAGAGPTDLRYGSRKYMTREDHEDAHFFAFVAHNTKAYGHDKGNWRKAPPREGKEPQRIGNLPLSFTEYRREHGRCWVCYGKGQSHKHDHRKVQGVRGGQVGILASPPGKSPQGDTD